MMRNQHFWDVASEKTFNYFADSDISFYLTQKHVKDKRLENAFAPCFSYNG